MASNLYPMISSFTPAEFVKLAYEGRYVPGSEGSTLKLQQGAPAPSWNRYLQQLAGQSFQQKATDLARMGMIDGMDLSQTKLNKLAAQQQAEEAWRKEQTQSTYDKFMTNVGDWLRQLSGV